MATYKDYVSELEKERDRWKTIAIEQHLQHCALGDHDLCIDYLEWKKFKAVGYE